MQEAETTTLTPRWASPADAERLYGISRTQLWRLKKAKEITAARVGRTVKYAQRRYTKCIAWN
jgi:hypothetical protein